MGFFNSCVNILLKLTSYAQYLEEPGQRPLPLPEHPVGLHDVISSVAGVSFAPQNASAGFSCQYPSLTGWQACNSPSDRSCWINDPKKKEAVWQYNITTNYEEFTPPGILREYWLNVSIHPISPDGYVKPLAQVYNNSYPGPLLEACWGDTVKVHITNLDPKEGHTTHWHGIRQLGTNQMDGVNGVTQCPIARNSTFTYEFKIGQYSHTWYHAHYQTQYSDGTAGPLVLYGPSSADYDEAYPPVLVNDYVHENASKVFEQELNGGIPLVDNIIFNGKGSYLCSDLDPRCCSACHGECTPDAACATSTNPTGAVSKLTFKKSKKYLLRLINASAESMFIFSIDGHSLQVISTDLVPIHPYRTKSLSIGIGQRYSVIVTADQPKTQTYWIRARVASGCGNVIQKNEQVGVLQYFNGSTGTPNTFPNDERVLCEDEPQDELNPIVPWKIPGLSAVQGDIDNFTFEADISSAAQEGGFRRWELTDSALFLNYSDPSILHVDNPNFKYPSSYAVIPYDYSTGYVWLVITGRNIDKLKRPAPAAHPIHLHGHDFVILAQDNSTFNSTHDVPNFNLDNPPRRDVALLYAGGYLALAFKPDNPGVWLVHCHIAWHASSGLALQVMERQDQILNNLGGEHALAPARAGCESWDRWHLSFDQVDSGV